MVFQQAARSARGGLVALAGSLCLLQAIRSSAQEGVSLPFENRVAGKNVRKAFEPLRKLIQEQSVAIYERRKDKRGNEVPRARLYGTLMREDGYFLTKASDFKALKGRIILRIGRKSFGEFEFLGEDKVWDVALLKVQATGLKAVDCLPDAVLPHGTWVISNGGTSRRHRRARAGVVSANTRAITGQGQAALGLTINPLEKAETGLFIGSVIKGSGAEKAGLKKDRKSVV